LLFVADSFDGPTVVALSAPQLNAGRHANIEIIRKTDNAPHSVFGDIGPRQQCGFVRLWFLNAGV